MVKELKLYILKLIIKISKAYDTSKILYEKKNLRAQFKFCGNGLKIGRTFSIVNPRYVEIGKYFKFKDRFRLEAIDQYGIQQFSPSIIIGNNVSFNTDIHIGCINKITIGDNCLFGSRILITDHNHGDTSKENLKVVPEKRLLISKGPVKIGINVWVGEGVAILSGVSIGDNSIVSANSVVTKDVPPNSVVAGVPARMIKNMN